jgi:heptosyltransferase-3
MRILLIKPKHIGDTLILTPTIGGIKRAFPDAEIWVVVRRGCEGILAGCPDIHRILTVVAVEKRERRRGDIFRDAGSLLQLRRVKFDYAFELGDGSRGRIFTVLSRSARRYSVKPDVGFHPTKPHQFSGISKLEWKKYHRVEKDYFTVSEFLPLPLPIPPLRFDREFAQSWKPAEELTDFCVMQTGKRQAPSRWRLDRWEEVGRHLLERFRSVVILSGPAGHEVEEALALKERLGPRVLCTLGQTNWPQVAGLLYRARLYVGLDTAATHLAAACRCPIVALFGPTYEGHWHPWQAPHRIVNGTNDAPTGDKTFDYERAKRRSMDDIHPRDVIAACEDILSEAPQPA